MPDAYCPLMVHCTTALRTRQGRRATISRELISDLTNPATQSARRENGDYGAFGSASPTGAIVHDFVSEP
jgi:hypothetical protein